MHAYYRKVGNIKNYEKIKICYSTFKALHFSCFVMPTYTFVKQLRSYCVVTDVLKKGSDRYIKDGLIALTPQILSIERCKVWHVL